MTNTLNYDAKRDDHDTALQDLITPPKHENLTQKWERLEKLYAAVARATCREFEQDFPGETVPLTGTYQGTECVTFINGKVLVHGKPVTQQGGLAVFAIGALSFFAQTLLTKKPEATDG